jgi:predicted naringenin-chalcone synthase
MSYITSIGVANPEHCFEQPVIARFMSRAMGLNPEEERKLFALYRATGIETRYSVLSDYGKTDHFEFYSNSESLAPFPSTKSRLTVFREEALKLSLKSIGNCFYQSSVKASEITHLIVVSCTGMYAPGLDIDVVKSLGLSFSIKRTCINFMGCYAAFNALKLAESFCSEGVDTKVLVVCTEMCSLHFQKENTEDNWLANALFADGSSAVLVEAKTEQKTKLELKTFHCDLAIGAENEMAWTIGDFGFEMRLSTYVPDAIQNGIRNLTENLLSTISAKVEDISFFAIHPGGKRILEVIGSELNLSKNDLRHSYGVLKSYGNMSSPTVLFVMKSIFDSLNEQDDEKKILSFAFGPGLTLESMLLQIHVKK